MHGVCVKSMKVEKDEPIDDTERTLLYLRCSCTTQASDAAGHCRRSQEIRVRNQGHGVGLNARSAFA